MSRRDQKGPVAIGLPGIIQVAGIIDQEEADLVIDSGADMLGFPLGLKDGREDLCVEAAAAIVKNTSTLATSVCITYHDTADAVLELCGRLGVNWVQLHGHVSPEETARIKSLDPDMGIIKSLIVRSGNPDSLANEVREYEELVDAFITDTFDPDTGRTGATGMTHDWSVSRELVRQSRLPVILAGGLDDQNVADSIGAVSPAAVDAHTGLEGPDGRKCAKKLRSFCRQAKDKLSG